MKMTYWMLWALSFLAFAAFCYAAFPAIFISLGFAAGALLLYLGMNPLAGEIMIEIGTFFWRHYIIAFLIILLFSAMLVFATKRLSSTSIFRKIRLEKGNREQ